MNDHHNQTSFEFLTKGSQVEVSSGEDGFSGAWYVATVINPPPLISDTNHRLVYLEYHNLLTEDGSSNRLREYANISYVRPSPPPDTNPPVFQLNDVVDAFHRDSWRTGVITNVVDAFHFVVTFQNPNEQTQFHCSKLRIHRKWVGGRWFQPQKQETAGLMFTVGKKVEVSFEIESLRDCWFPATILKNSDNNTFLVEYQQPGAGDEPILHKVTVDYHHIRPSPPHLRDKNFVLLEKVDVYYDFGWWSGVITKELADNRYNVNFTHNKKDREFVCSRVRPHMEWKDGKWFNASQGDTDGRTSHSLIEQIEQTTPSVDKQSTVATSIMTKTRQENLDSNDNVSMPSKKPQDEIMNEGLSKKINSPSVGHSEGFDSEVSGMTDQSFENLSHGQNVRSELGKGIGVKTLTTDSSTKRGKLANELKSLQASDEGSKVDSIKTRTLEIVGKKDITKDTPYRILPTGANNEGTERDAASVAPKRKRGRPPKLLASSPKTPVTFNNQNGSDVPSAVSVVEGGQKKEIGLTTSSATKSLEENQGPVKEQPGMQNAPLSKDKLANENTGQDLDVQLGQGTEKYSANKGKRVKRRTMNINTESLTQESLDTSKKKVDGSLEKDSATRYPEASVGKSLDNVSDDRPLSRWFEAKHAPITVHGPEGTVEQSSKVSERLVTCDIDPKDMQFVRSTPLWKTIESMEAFRMLPQKPHFRPLLEGAKESTRQGLAVGIMVTFSTVVDKTRGLRFNDPRSKVEDHLETLVELENNGFDVEVIRERLIQLLLIKDKQNELEARSKQVVEKFQEHNVLAKRNEEEIEAIDRQIRELEEKRKQVLLKKEKNCSEIGVMEAKNEEIEQEMRALGAEFDGLATAPLSSKL